MEQISFTERVSVVAIEQAKLYQSIYVEWEYLICSTAFTQKPYYIIDAKQDNFQHLIGVHSKLSPQEFFDKCLNETLNEKDFDFIKKNADEKSVKGSVRRKIKSLPLMMSLFQDKLSVQEAFVKNKISCAFAGTDNAITIGFAGGAKTRPMTLLISNELDMSKAQDVDFIFKKRTGEKLFDTVVSEKASAFTLYEDNISNLITPELLQQFK